MVSSSHENLAHPESLSGLIRLHALRHAVDGVLTEARMLDELEHHSYKISSGTLYPMVPSLEYVLETEEFEDSHLTGAGHISRALLAQNIYALVSYPVTPIICYCAGGNRGELAEFPALSATPQSPSTSPQ